MSERILKVNQLIRKELSRIILRELDFSPGIFVTLTRVQVSHNLAEAKVFISVMPDSKAKHVLQIINRQIYFLQQKLNKRLKMRPVPRIEFREEKQTSQAGRIDELLAELKKEEK